MDTLKRSIRSRHTSGLIPVVAALFGNIFVAIIKLFAALASGSSSLFSEAIHSCADTINQILLLVGLWRSKRQPDEEFSYGYGNERFFWGLISACGVFFLGAGVTIYKGVFDILHPESVHVLPIMFVVLIVAFGIELCTFLLAARELAHRLPKNTWVERLEEGDPSTLAVLYEDGAAVIGVVVAAFSLLLTSLTGNPIWDASGSIIIGLLLGAMALLLISKNRSYLLGKSIPTDMEEDIIAGLESDPVIEKVIDFKSEVLDIGVYRIKCDIEFNGNMLMKELFRNKGDLREQYDEVKDDYEEFKKFCVDYADRIPRLIGRKIDAIEADLKQRYPTIKYIDIEVN